jgi:hypothetical protein
MTSNPQYTMATHPAVNARLYANQPHSTNQPGYVAPGYPTASYQLGAFFSNLRFVVIDEMHIYGVFLALISPI